MRQTMSKYAVSSCPVLSWLQNPVTSRLSRLVLTVLGYLCLNLTRMYIYRAGSADPRTTQDSRNLGQRNKEYRNDGKSVHGLETTVVPRGSDGSPGRGYGWAAVWAQVQRCGATHDTGTALTRESYLPTTLASCDILVGMVPGALVQVHRNDHEIMRHHGLDSSPEQTTATRDSHVRHEIRA